MTAHKVLSQFSQKSLLIVALAFLANPASAQFGVYMSASGAVNRGMGGASTAAPLSPAGALYWNPATISGLEKSELEFGAELLLPRTQLASNYSAGALGPGIPPVTLSGQQDSDIGAIPMPTIGLVYKPEDSILSYGLGIFAVAGFGVDYSGSFTNPIATAPPPVGLGFGPAHSDYEVLQIAPAINLQLSDRLSVAAGPTLNIAKLSVNPALFGVPDDARGDGFATYPQGTHSQTTWGGGFNVGAYYHQDVWGFGASFKSPQWFDKFRFNSSDELGRPRELTFDLDLPMVVSVGTAYSGLERWVFALDGRYMDYRNTNGFGDRGFTDAGSLRGLGFRSIFAAAVGAQYQVCDTVFLRLGYSWSDNPIPNDQAVINALSPVIIQHMLSLGASWQVTPDFKLSMAYVHGFENSVEGPLVTPAGPVPGTAVRDRTWGDIFSIGGSVTFGAKN
ncbi:MAG: OmpP1/FadL family transporter [Gemmataceae bacterium]